MVLISVDLPLRAGVDKSPICYFKRSLSESVLQMVPLDTIVTTLHALYVGVDHEINVKYQFQ